MGSISKEEKREILGTNLCPTHTEGGEGHGSGVGMDEMMVDEGPSMLAPGRVDEGTTEEAADGDGTAEIAAGGEGKTGETGEVEASAAETKKGGTVMRATAGEDGSAGRQGRGSQEEQESKPEPRAQQPGESAGPRGGRGEQ